MIKPDGVQRAKMGDVIHKFERRGFKLSAMKFMEDKEGKFLAKHYEEHKDRPFYARLMNYMKSGPLLAMVWEGTDVIKTSRKLIGVTKPEDRDAATLRFDHCLTNNCIIHGSDSVEAAEREIGIWFKPSEMTPWKDHSNKWIYE